MEEKQGMATGTKVGLWILGGLLLITVTIGVISGMYSEDSEPEMTYSQPTKSMF